MNEQPQQPVFIPRPIQVPPPVQVQPVYEETYEEPPEERDPNDTSDLFEVDEEDPSELADIVDVSQEDIMGKPPASRKKRMVRRTTRQYNPPGMSGMVM
jgi:hypothetical protein